MFDGISPKLKNLLGLNNTWNGVNTYQRYNQLTSPTALIKLTNPTRAITGATVQVSPSIVWEGRALSSGTTSLPTAFRMYALPVAASPTYGSWKLQYSLNNAAFTDALTWSAAALNSKPLFTVSAYQKINTDNSSTVDTLQSLNVNSTGSTNHITMSSSNVIKGAWSVFSTGTNDHKAAGSSPIHNFYVGGSITSQLQICQIYGSGIYNSYNTYTQGVVTAGQGDTSVQTTLSTYGSFAAKGTLVTSSTYTLAQTETFVYADPSNSNFCTGTPTACNTYVIEATCNAHTGVGCSWFAGNSCSAASGTDSGTCTGQGAGCTWEEVACSGANNTDQTTCEQQDDSYGGNCSWDTSTCPSQGDETSCEAISGCTWSGEDCHGFDGQSQATCEGNSGCSWVGGDCNSFDGTDQSTCESGHTGCAWNSADCITTYFDESSCNAVYGCSWDGMACQGTAADCSGVYDEGSTCSGQYNTTCSGSLCTGDYATGNCNGTYGAGCQGTASCNNLTDDGSVACAAESGCTWTVGITVTLPTHANANRSGTGRVYSIMHVGSSGTVSIVGQSGQPIFQYTNLTLFKKGDKVLLHNQSITFQCSLLTTQSPCEAQSGCTWHPTTDCSGYGDETACNNAGNGAGCSWNGSSCDGGIIQQFCSGTYTNGSYWYAHSLERGLNYVEKTANYTLTDIDDVVNCTANSFDITLPSAALNNGKQYSIKNLGAGTITLKTTSGQTIDGNASGTLTLTTGQSMVVVSNNSNWIKIA